MSLTFEIRNGVYNLRECVDWQKNLSVFTYPKKSFYSRATVNFRCLCWVVCYRLVAFYQFDKPHVLFVKITLYLIDIVDHLYHLTGKISREYANIVTMIFHKQI